MFSSTRSMELFLRRRVKDGITETCGRCCRTAPVELRTPSSPAQFQPAYSDICCRSIERQAASLTTRLRRRARINCQHFRMRLRLTAESFTLISFSALTDSFSLLLVIVVPPGKKSCAVSRSFEIEKRSCVEILPLSADGRAPNRRQRI